MNKVLSTQLASFENVIEQLRATVQEQSGVIQDYLSEKTGLFGGCHGRFDCHPLQRSKLASWKVEPPLWG